MTDSTKQLFDAPWVVMGDAEDYIKFNVIISSPNSPRHCCTIASCIDQKTAHRLARLPELYDALVEAVNDACQDCVDQVYDHPTDYDPVKYGCLFKDKNCCEKCRSWIELLRKVRDGK